MRRSTTGLKKNCDLRRWLPALAAPALLAVACTAPPKVPFTHLMKWDGRAISGYYYPVRRGDTLASIAEHFQLDLDLIARINRIRPDVALGAGDRIFIPRTGTEFNNAFYRKPRYDERKRTKAAPIVPVSDGGYSGRMPPPPRNVIFTTSQAASRPARPAAVQPTPRVIARGATGGPSAPTAGPSQSRSYPSTARPTTSNANTRKRGIRIAQSYTKRLFSKSSQTRVPNHPAFQWPAGGTITSGYNVSSSKSRIHLGIDIGNREGTPIRAAYSGRVLYSDSEYLPSMGNMVLIEHDSGWVTLYAHNLRNLVKEGDHVERGQTVALMGETGRATGPHLHFEIRKNAETPVNPIDYLPRRR